MTSWPRIIAPSAGHAVRRVSLVLMAAAVILAAIVALEGLPMYEHDLHQNEALIFEANFYNGVTTIITHILVITIIAFIGRRVFKIRL